MLVVQYKKKYATNNKNIKNREKFFNVKKNIYNEGRTLIKMRLVMYFLSNKT